jgi:predicted ATPase
MIRKLTIDNLKSIKHLDIECTDINLFVGTNSSGKSSILQGLLFVTQNIDKTVGLNGNFISLGKPEENRCVYAEKKEISAGVEVENKHSLEVKLLYREGIYVPKMKMTPKISENNAVKMLGEPKKVQYLSCHRVGPQSVYNKNMSIEDESLGNNGEYAVAYLNGHGPDILDRSICKGSVDYTLLGQVNWWLSYIMDVEISTEEILGTNLVKASYSTNDMQGVRPENIGAGISYLLSIIIVCLASPVGAILVIENPEIHLHPSAQAKICEFFYFIATSGRQLFIETHSDHIFNGFRAGISTGDMEDEKINIQFIRLGEAHVTEATKVIIGRRGRIENQQRDLFDQFDLDMNRMIGIGIRKGSVNGDNRK